MQYEFILVHKTNKLPGDRGEAIQKICLYLGKVWKETYEVRNVYLRAEGFVGLRKIREQKDEREEKERTLSFTYINVLFIKLFLYFKKAESTKLHIYPCNYFIIHV